PQKEQVAHGTPRSIQPGQKHLVNLGDLFNSLVLAYDAAAQGGFKLSSIGAAAVRIEHGSEIRSHKIFSFSSQAVFLGLLPAFRRTLQALVPRNSRPFQK